ncbi:hypothetical protein [Hymenobacter psoromatis]|uniref:hypothetical protein n=1 Tax=Hymenobacter psoromatis TaxID=1484116 RepID=UPI001CBFC56C|nr:hypothetical protein [Hymenobacter psoromatis]
MFRRCLLPVGLPGRLLRKAAWLGLAALLGPGAARGQSADSLAGIGRRFAQYSQRVPTEKLFVHLDRPCYLSGESLWFKLYAVEGTTQRPLAASSVAYVEVLDPAQVPVLQVKVKMAHATGQGSLVLPPELPSGRYTVRAYTSWMQNFGPEYFFQRVITVVNTRAPLPLAGPAARPAPAYDPQFFPEGGYLVQGLASKVGFKLTDRTGRGVAAEGRVLDQTGATVARFKTLRFGLGSFDFTPAQAGAAYKAVMEIADQPPITCALPAVREQGYVLRLEDLGPEQLRVVVQARGAALAAENLYLLGHAGQRVAVAASAQLQAGQAVFVVPKQQLAAGVSHFTLFNSRRQPVCERLYFRPPPTTLALRAQADKRQYAAREKVTLQLGSGPQPANLSVAVYQLDSLAAGGEPGITSYLWLAADLKGQVENPDYYLASPTPETQAATDNLMLTQGWSRFSWAQVLAEHPDSLAYLPELNGPVLRGRVVSTRTGAPVTGVGTYLASPSRRIQFFNSFSKKDGSIQFELPDFYGTRQLIVQPNSQRDSLCTVELFSPFSPRYAANPPAPLTLAEGVAASLLRRHVQAEVQQQFSDGHPARYLAPLLDSTAFYGKPSEQYFLDKYTRFKVMEEVMREYVPGVLVRIRKDGFHFLVPDDNSREMLESPLVLLDGVPVFNTNRIMAFDPLKVQKLDVLTSRYSMGQFLYEGVVSYTTYKGDLAGLEPDPRALLQAYEGLQGQRAFYAPRYETPAAAQSRLPDFRNLLYWNPELLSPPGGGTQTSFYTSDQVGSYRVVVQGLSPTGLTGSTSFTFEVKAAL